MKKISIMLTLSVLFSILPNGICANAKETSVLISDDFEGYSAGYNSFIYANAATEQWIHDGLPLLEVKDLADGIHNKVLAINQSCESGGAVKAAENNAVYMLNPDKYVYETDVNNRVKYELDICPDPSGTGTNTYFSYIVQGRKADGTETADAQRSIYSVMFAGGRISLGSWIDGTRSNGQSVYEPGKWYHIEAILDMVSDTSDIKVVNDRGVEVAAYSQKLKTASQQNASYCKGMKVYTNAIEDSQVYIDNVQVTRVDDDEAVNKRQLYFKDDFNGYETAEDVHCSTPNSLEFVQEQVRKAGWTYGNKASARNCAVAEKNTGDKYFMLGTDGTANTTLSHSFDTIDSGIFEYEYDIEPTGSATTTMRISGAGGTGITKKWISPLVFISDKNGNHHIQTFEETYSEDYRYYIGDFTPGNRYHCKVTADIDNQSVTISVIGDDVNIKKTENIISGYSKSGFYQLEWAIWYDPTTNAAAKTGIDNFEIGYVTDTPEISLSYCIDDAEYDVPAAHADTVILKFSSPPAATAFSNGKVRLTDEDGAELAFDGTLTGSKYIMKLTDSIIEKYWKYTLTLADSICSVNLERINQTRIDFTGTEKPSETTVDTNKNILLLTDDFESYENSADAFSETVTYEKWNEYRSASATGYVTAASIEDIGGEHGKVLKTPAKNNGIEVGNNETRTFATQSFGIIKYEFDTYTSGANNMVHAGGSWAYFCLMNFSDDGNLYVLDYKNNPDCRLGKYLSNTWYHCEFEIDMNTKTLNYTIEGGGRKISGYDVHFQPYLDLLKPGYSISTIGGINHKVAGTGYAYLDNVSVYVVPEHTITPPTELITENFEYASAADCIGDSELSTDKWYEKRSAKNGSEVSDTAQSFIVPRDPNYGRSLGIYVTKTCSNVEISKRFDSVRDGIVNVELSVCRPDGIGTEVVLQNGSGGITVLEITPDGIAMAGGKTIANVIPQKWYRIASEIDLDNKVMNVRIYDEDGIGGEAEFLDADGAESADGMKVVAGSAQSASSYSVYIDNVKVYRAERLTVNNPDLIPMPNVPEITLLADNEVIADAAAAADADEIRLDFGTKMDITSLYDIELANKTDNKTAAYSLRSNDDGTYSILPDSALLKSHCYSVKVPAQCASAAYAQIGRNSVFEFITVSGEFSAAIISAEYADSDETEPGTERVLATAISYTNLSGAEQHAILMYCTYKDNEPVSIVRKDITIPASDGTETMQFKQKLENAGADKVSVMLWNSVNGAKPLADCVDVY